MFGLFLFIQLGATTFIESMVAIYYLLVAIGIALIIQIVMSYNQPTLKNIQAQLNTQTKLLNEIINSKEQEKN